MIAVLKAMEVGIQMIQPTVDVIEYTNTIERVTRPDVFQEEDTTILYDWCFRDNKFFCEPSWVVKKDRELELYNNDEFDKEHTFVVISDKNKQTISKK